jgi:hypothetical protein
LVACYLLLLQLLLLLLLLLRQCWWVHDKLTQVIQCRFCFMCCFGCDDYC